MNAFSYSLFVACYCWLGNAALLLLCAVVCVCVCVCVCLLSLDDVFLVRLMRLCNTLCVSTAADAFEKKEDCIALIRVVVAKYSSLSCL